MSHINLLLTQPTPEQIKSARLGAGLTQTDAAKLIGYKLRGWQDAESGTNNIKSCAWSLFLLAVGKHPAFVVSSI